MVKWEEVSFGDCIQVYQPETIAAKSLSKSGSYPVYGANGVIGYHDSYNHEEAELILGCRGSVGSVHVTEPRSWINGNSMVVRPSIPNLDLDFIRYGLLGGFSITDAISGTAQPQITRTSLSPLKFKLPPLDEQKRIVAKLDEALSVVESLKANTAQSKSELDSFWQSALTQAFSQDWLMAKLGEIADFERGLTYAKSDESSFSSVVVLRANNVDLDAGQIILDDLKYLRDDFVVPQKKQLRMHSILICTASGSKSHLGKVALNSELEGFAFGGFMGQVIPKEALASRFLFLNLITKRYRDYIGKLTDGANINNLKWSQLSEFEIPLPPLDEQKRIVAKLDEVKTELDRQREILSKKESETERLRSSILTAAFNGEL